MIYSIGIKLCTIPKVKVIYQLLVGMFLLIIQKIFHTLTDKGESYLSLENTSLRKRRPIVPGKKNLAKE